MNRLSLFAKLSISLVVFWLILFALFPNLLVIGISFLTKSESDFFTFAFSTESYTKLLNPVYLSVFLDSLYLAFITTVMTLILAYPFAYIIATVPKKYKFLLLLLVIIPFWTSSLVRTYALIAILKTKGLLNAFLLSLGLINEPLQIMYTEVAVFIGMVYTLLPFMILPLYVSIEKIDFKLVEAAKDLGASKLNIFKTIIIPLSLPGIIAGSTLVFLPALGMFFIPDILGGAKELIVGSFIRNQFLLFRDWPFGSAASVILLIIMFIMLSLLAKSQKIESSRDKA
ncbi:spermidine/putrescine ABC transporter permease PotB [Halarcobacter ebronensis]|uniref:Spermidine/putrescine ABC transporter permease PotB n=1 Tax=Halarcobacter ebronensis TaxID=1462615 RepID=A0A4Q0YBF2_9BACT|nr:spermidine/putrescine ABC transporter permease PotB [Halarcobacter ebronensis]RXJ67660.1 spermidine/putrescine ABC transporter permease PotB [Halarcobacter ebronensis]